MEVCDFLSVIARLSLFLALGLVVDRSRVFPELGEPPASIVSAHFQTRLLMCVEQVSASVAGCLGVVLLVASPLYFLWGSAADLLGF